MTNILPIIKGLSTLRLLVVALLVLIGGYVVIQSIFRISINDPLNATLKEEILSIDGVMDVAEKREAFIEKVAITGGYSSVGASDILNEKIF